MVRTEDSVGRVSGKELSFALHHGSWMRVLLKVLPGKLESSGLVVSDAEVVVRIRPGGKVRIPRQAITRVWRTEAGDQGLVFWLPPLFIAHSNFRGIWWLNRSLANLVAIDIDPPATARMWRMPVKPRRVVVSLEDPEDFVTEMLD
ncbi:MAG TPA: hypothetical protein VKX16_11170 [Chloroflexota bacterium]|nr:hypothetical protein [Chloroflexota bacterium]